MYFCSSLKVTNLLDARGCIIHLPHHSKPNKLSKDLTSFVSCSFALLIPTYPIVRPADIWVRLTKAFGGRLQVCTMKMLQTCIWFPIQVEKAQDISVWFGSVRFGLVWSL
jgi:hypothetical protein